MRLPRLQRYDGQELVGLPYDGMVKTIGEMGMRCVLRSTSVSSGRISDGIVVFEDGRPVASYFEEDGERLFGDRAISKMSFISGKKKVVTDVFTLTSIQLKMVLRQDERLLVKGKTAAKPRPPWPLKKKMELISKITDIARRARGEKEAQDL